jgi:hypothetical protein
MLVFISSMYSLLFCEKRSMCFFNQYAGLVWKVQSALKTSSKGKCAWTPFLVAEEWSWVKLTRWIDKSCQGHPSSPAGRWKWSLFLSWQALLAVAITASMIRLFASMHRYRTSWLGRFAPVNFLPTIFAPMCYSLIWQIHAWITACLHWRNLRSTEWKIYER